MYADYIIGDGKFHNAPALPKNDFIIVTFPIGSFQCSSGHLNAVRAKSGPAALTLGIKRGNLDNDA